MSDPLTMTASLRLTPFGRAFRLAVRCLARVGICVDASGRTLEWLARKCWRVECK